MRHIDAPHIFAIAGLGAEAITVAFLAIPGAEAKVELLEYEGVERHPASSRPCDPGAGHFCLYVDDLVAVHARLRQAGYDPRAPEPVAIPVGPAAGAEMIYAIDPDGYLVELVQAP